MLEDYSLLPYFINEDLFLLPQDRQAIKRPQPYVSVATSPAPAQESAPEAEMQLPKPAPAVQAKPEKETKRAPASAPAKASPDPKPNPNLIFGKNKKQLLILVEDHQNPVMERADGLLLKDILKAVGYTFDDVAIVNICHCREEIDWQTVKEIPFTTLFSFGITHPQLPYTKALAPYELERSGERTFMLADKLSVLRANRARKITLWNLLKEIFV